jgi:predicted small integral membrane protein
MKHWVANKNRFFLAVDKTNQTSVPDKAVILTGEQFIYLSKIILTGAMALFFTLTVINYVSYYSVHFVFLQQVMSMKAVFLDNQASWRAISTPLLQHSCYWLFILGEIVAAILCWLSVYNGWSAIQLNCITFQSAKALAIGGLSLGMLMWIIAFSIGNEWFLMWQADIWNGQETAFRLATLIGMVLIFVSLPERNIY